MLYVYLISHIYLISTEVKKHSGRFRVVIRVTKQKLKFINLPNLKGNIFWRENTTFLLNTILQRNHHLYFSILTIINYLHILIIYIFSVGAYCFNSILKLKIGYISKFILCSTINILC